MVAERCLLVFSTLGEEAKSSMMEKIKVATGKDGVKMFKFYSMKGYCRTCYDQGRKEKCTHMRPPWHGLEKKDDLKLFYEDENARQIELYGARVEGEEDRIFPEECVRCFNDNRRVAKLNETYTHFYVAVDPYGGGSMSRFCCVATLWYHERTIVCINYPPPPCRWCQRPCARLQTSPPASAKPSPCPGRSRTPLCLRPLCARRALR